MIEKMLPPPTVRERLLRITDPAAYGTLSGLRRVGREIAAGEGEKRMGSLPEAMEKAVSAGDVSLFSSVGGGRLSLFPGGKTYGFGNRTLTGAVSFLTDGEKIYVLTDSALLCLADDSLHEIADMGGGNCICVHKERLFVGRENALLYSAPLRPEVWSSADRDAGEVPLTGNGGASVGLFSFGGKLYLLREREIVRVTADGDDLAFRMERVASGFGKVTAGSAVQCGEGFCFHADGTVYRFDGTLAPVAAFEAASADGAVSCAGAYFLLVGGKLFVAEGKTTRLLPTEATLLAGGEEGVLLVHGTTVYRLDAASSRTDGVLTVTVPIRKQGLLRVTESILFTGEGRFLCTAETASGACTFTVAAEKRTRLPRVLRGETLRLTIGFSEDSRLGEILLYLREAA